MPVNIESMIWTVQGFAWLLGFGVSLLVFGKGIVGSAMADTSRSIGSGITHMKAWALGAVLVLWASAIALQWHAPLHSSPWAGREEQNLMMVLIVVLTLARSYFFKRLYPVVEKHRRHSLLTGASRREVLALSCAAVVFPLTWGLGLLLSLRGVFSWGISLSDCIANYSLTMLFSLVVFSAAALKKSDSCKSSRMLSFQSGCESS